MDHERLTELHTRWKDDRDDLYAEECDELIELLYQWTVELRQNAKGEA